MPELHTAESPSLRKKDYEHGHGGKDRMGNLYSTAAPPTSIPEGKRPNFHIKQIIGAGPKQLQKLKILQNRFKLILITP